MDRKACDADPGLIVTGASLQDTEKENEAWRERYTSLFAELELPHRRANLISSIRPKTDEQLVRAHVFPGRFSRSVPI